LLLRGIAGEGAVVKFKSEPCCRGRPPGRPCERSGRNSRRAS